MGRGYPTAPRWAGGIAKRDPTALTCTDGTAYWPGIRWDCAWDAAARVDFYSLVVLSLIPEPWFESVG